MKKYLVIAHYDGDHTPVVDAVRELAQQDPQATFHLIVPATPPHTGEWTWTDEEAYRVGKQRMASLLSEFKSANATITGDVVNYTTTGAVEEALQKDSYDELVVGTPREGDARTTFEELEQHVQRLSQIPMRHVVALDAQAVHKA